MQDRILGPLTMVQFIYAVIGGGLCYIIFMQMPSPFSIALIIPIVMFIVCLDFVKINERPFLDFFLAAIHFISAPKQKTWQRSYDSNFRVEIYHAKKEQAEIPHKEISQSEIAAAAKGVDTGAGNLLIRR